MTDRTADEVITEAHRVGALHKAQRQQEDDALTKPLHVEIERLLLAAASLRKQVDKVTDQRDQALREMERPEKAYFQQEAVIAALRAECDEAPRESDSTRRVYRVQSHGARRVSARPKRRLC